VPWKKYNPTKLFHLPLIFISSGIISAVLFSILIGDSAGGHEVVNPRGAFHGYLFESVSAFATVGLSVGVTPQLNK
jgi:trk system potassium uptake protein TrkH